MLTDELPKQERPSRDEVFLMMALAISQRSTCLRAQVGAIIVKDNRPVSMGYNGVPSGYKHCEKCKGAGCDISIHAEMNAIAFAAKEGISTKDSTLYVTMSPCVNCAKVIINSGIKKVVFLERYRDVSGINFLRYNNIIVEDFEKCRECAGKPMSICQIECYNERDERIEEREITKS